MSLTSNHLPGTSEILLLKDYILFFPCIKWNFIKPSSIICHCCKIIWLKTPWHELPKPEQEIKSPAELAVCLEVILFNMQLCLMILAALQRYREGCSVRRELLAQLSPDKEMLLNQQETLSGLWSEALFIYMENVCWKHFKPSFTAVLQAAGRKHLFLWPRFWPGWIWPVSPPRYKLTSLTMNISTDWKDEGSFMRLPRLCVM